MPAKQVIQSRFKPALLWLLWHHQGGSSVVGQPIREMLKIGPCDELTYAELGLAEEFQKTVERGPAPLGVVDSLLDAAFKQLQHDTGEQDKEYQFQRTALAVEFRKILRAYQTV